MHVLLLTQYYTPEPVDKWRELVQALCARGDTVEVLTGFPCYPLGKVYEGYRQTLGFEEPIDGARVVRVPQLPDHSDSAVRRVLYYVSFALSAAFFGLFRTKRPDVILAYQSALPIGFTARVLSVLKRAPYVLDVVDLWPESVAASGMLKSPALLGLIRAGARYVYRHACRINVITRGYRRSLLRLGVRREKLRLIPCWPGRGQFDPVTPHPGFLRQEGLADKFNITYAGAIGPCQGLEVLLQAADRLRDLHEVQFVVAGSGVSMEELTRLRDSMQLSSVQLLGRRSPADVASLFAASEMLFVHLKPNEMSRLSIPSKTLSYLASGRPLLMAVEGEASRLVARHGCGEVVPPSDPIQLAAAIRRHHQRSVAEREMMGAKARRTYEDHFSDATLVPKVIQTLEAAAAEPGWFTQAYRQFGKRTIDVVASASLLAILSPVLTLTAIAVGLRLGSPVLFRQTRPGCHGKLFSVCKFRSMSDRHDSDGAPLPDADRLGVFGRLLRASSLDELPQLWNVLRGEMSLIGPRPLLPEYLERYTKTQARRHEMRPGITGLAQVRGRNAIAWEERFRFDVEYVEKCSPWLDLKILAWTAVKVLRRDAVSAPGHATMTPFRGESPSELFVYGGGGHAKVILEAARAVGLEPVVCDDDPAKSGAKVLGARVLGPSEIFDQARARPAIVAIGSNAARRSVVERITAQWTTVVHPQAVVSTHAELGRGVFVGPAAVVNADAKIGDHAIINTRAVVEHDAHVGDFAHVAPGAVLAGGAVVGSGCLIGAGATLLPGVTIGDGSTVGAGAVVIGDLPPGCTAVGTPARVLPSKTYPARAA